MLAMALGDGLDVLGDRDKRYAVRVDSVCGGAPRVAECDGWGRSRVEDRPDAAFEIVVDCFQSAQPPHATPPR
ncbi:MAG: hypothetical protein KY433_10490 [Actinobacteria bacterium]|nr:hypothetical protein [Actinomycetota bacterium]